MSDSISISTTSTTPSHTHSLTEKQLKGFKQAFTIFDKDGSGAISSAELAIAVKSLGHSVSDAALQQMIRDVEPDGDEEHIEFSTFVAIMMHSIKASKAVAEGTTTTTGTATGTTTATTATTPGGVSVSVSSNNNKNNNKEFVKSMSSSSSSSTSIGSGSGSFSSSFSSTQMNGVDDVTLQTGADDTYTAYTEDLPPVASSTIEVKKKEQDQGIDTSNNTTKNTKLLRASSSGVSVSSSGTAKSQSKRKSKSSTLPSRGSKVWVLGEDSEWRLATLEKVKKPVEVQGRKVVALHVLMDEIPTPPSQDGVEESVLPTAGEGAQKVIHTTFENDDESEYVLVKRTSLLSNGEIALSPVTLRKLDIAILSVINEPEMLNFLRLRYNSTCRFFAIGPMMLAFTVHKRSGANTQQPMKSLPYYANNDVLSEQDAGVSSLAQRMCARLCPLTGSSGAGSSISDVRNQAVLLQGESGSGKSTMTKELTQRVVAVLASFSETKIPDVKINDDVLYDMNCILETFGHSQTKSNPNSSRFSKSVKLHVDSTSQDLAGVLVRCYYLELERVTQCPAEECNFNVFYDVFDDVFFSEIAADRYAIEDITSFKYTPHKPVSRLNEPGKSAFKDLTKAFRDLLGIPKKDHRLIYGVLAAILHLGEVQLEQGEEVDGNPTVAYCEDEENMDHVDRVSKLLGLSHSALLTVLTKRHVNFAGTIVAKHLSLNEAVAAKDAMASHLYLSLFKSLLSSINTAIHKKFLGKHTIFGEEEEVDAEERNEEEFDMLASRSVIALYDFPGFEYSKPSNISGLCKNYINERLYQHYYQNVYKFDAAAFADNGISVAPLNMTSNGEIVKLLDNRSNGIFTIFNDQMKLKSKQLDAKVASIMYSQHGNSTIFDSGKKERKRLWFKIRHYNYAVSYDINGFKKQNKIQPSAEMVEFLRSSTIPYVHGLLHYCEVRSSLENPHLHGLEAAPLVEQSVTSSLERSMSRGFSSRPSFQSTPSTRNFMLQRSNSDIVSVYSVGQDDESVVSASSSMSRGSRKGANGKPITLASLTQTFMEEVITEITAAEVHVVLCIKPNDVNTCKDFDNYTVSRQLAPYEMQKVLRFYTTGYPYCVSLSAFSNRYSILSTTHKISESLSKAFTKMLLKCRALGSDIKTKQAHNLIKALLNLVSNLPELESEFGPLAGHQMEGDFYFEAVQTGLKVCDECVMMTALAYSYLEAAHKIAMTLVAHLLQRFYRGRVRPMIEFQIEKVKNVCRGFVARKSWAKKRLAVIKIQSVIRMFVIKSHYDYERQILSRIIRAQAVWRGKHKRQELAHSPPPRPSWMSDAKQMTAYHAYMTPLSEKNGFAEHDTPPGEKLDYTPHTSKKESVNRFMIKPSYTTEEEDSRSNDDEENENKAMHTSRLASSSSDTPGEGSGIGMGVGESKHELQTISELQAELEAMRLENKALRKMEKKFIQQSKSMNHIEEEVAIGGDDVERLGNRAHIINKQNTSNALDAEKLRCAYDGTRLLPDYDLYSARVLNAVQDDLSYLLKPTIFYKFGHQGSVRKALICVSPCFHYIMWKPKNSMFKKSEECKVDLRKVWNLAKGQTTPAFKEYKGITHGPMPPKLSFSLIFGFRSLDFCALDEHTYRQWFQGLQYIIELINGDSSEAGVDKQYYRSRWNYLDKHRNGVLNRKSVITLVASLGIKFTNDSFLTAILRSSIGNSRSDQITFSQFSSLIYQLTRRPDLEILWANLVDGKPFEEATFPLYASKDADSTKLFDVIGLATFRKFWKDYQGRALTVSEARVVVKEGMGAKFDPNFPVLSYGGFQAIMNHEKNDAYDPVKTHHNDIEMSSPLNHYYIATADGPAVGILPPRQHGSDTTNPYHIDVKRGCRCLEIRCFEGSIAPEHIDRKHGFRSDLFVSAPDQDQSHTGLGRLTFKETVLEISRVAFTLTHLPLVIMLDFSANVSLKLQQRAAKYLEKIFDDALYLPSQVSASEVSMPSPKSLKKRVIVFLSHRGSNINAAYVLAGPNSQAGNMQRKSTKTIGSRHSEEDDGSYTAKAIDDVDDVLEWRSEVASSPQQSLSRQQIRQHQSSSPMASAVSFYASVSPSAGSSDGPERSRAPIPIHESLFRICHYTADYRLATHDMSAIVSKLKSEPASAEQIRLYNTQNLSHVFMDTQTKVDSDHAYGHMVQLWDTGVPCISLCHHFPSLATKLHHGKFRANGGCGFVPKPLSLRGVQQDDEDEADEENAYVLLLHVISGQELPDSVPNIPEEDLEGNISSPGDIPHGLDKGNGFSVVMNLHDAMPVDNVEQKTRSVVSHGRNPFWNEVFSFAVKDMNRGQLTLRVFYDDYCEGFASIPLGCLRTGYRTVSLFNEDENDHFVSKKLECASLFVRVSLCPASSFKNIRQITRSASDAHTSPMKVIKQSKSFRSAKQDGSVKELPVECGVIQGIPPLNPVRGKFQYQPTPLAVQSVVALRHQPASNDVETPNSGATPPSKGTDYRKFNLYGQQSMDGIRSPQEQEVDSFEVVQGSPGSTPGSIPFNNPVTPPSKLNSRISSKNPIENLRVEGMRRAGSLGSASAGSGSGPNSPNTSRRGKLSTANDTSVRSNMSNNGYLRESSGEYSNNRQGLESARQIGGNVKDSRDTFGTSGDFDNDGIDIKFSSDSRDFSIGDEKYDEIDDDRSSRFTLNLKPSSSGSINDFSEQSADHTKALSPAGSRPSHLRGSSSRSMESNGSSYRRHGSRSSSRDHDHDRSARHHSRDRDDDSSHHSQSSRDRSTSASPLRAHRRATGHEEAILPLRFQSQHRSSSRGSSKEREMMSSSRNQLLSPVGEVRSDHEDDDMVSLHSFGSGDAGGKTLKGKSAEASMSFRDKEKARERERRKEMEKSADEGVGVGLVKKSSKAEMRSLKSDQKSDSGHSHHSSHHSRGHGHGHSSHSLHGHGGSSHSLHRHGSSSHRHGSSSHSLHRHGSSSHHGHHHSSGGSHHGHHRSSSSHHGSRGMHRQRSSRSTKDDHSVDLKELGERDQERKKEKEEGDKHRGRGLSRRESSRREGSRDKSSSRDREGSRDRERGLSHRESSRRRDRRPSTDSVDDQVVPTDPWDVGI